MKGHSPLISFILTLILVGCGGGPNQEQKAPEDQEEVDSTRVKASSKNGEAASKKPENPWSKDRLMKPGRLADMLKNSSNELPLIHCVGPTPMIPNSEHFGEAHKDSALNAFKKELKGLPKDSSLVIYCGCCPFEDCPNIRPAFSLLNKMGFEAHKLLGLSTSLKADWIDKGYPTKDLKGREKGG